MRSYQSVYHLFDCLIILVDSEVDSSIREKIKSELFLYHITEKELTEEKSKVTIRIRKKKGMPNLHPQMLRKDGISVAANQDVVSFFDTDYSGYEIEGAFSDTDTVTFYIGAGTRARSFWKLLENIIKVKLLKAGFIFIHGVAVRSAERVNLFLGWSGVGKTHFLIDALSRNESVLAEDFIVLSKGGKGIFPYVPLKYEVRRAHLKIPKINQSFQLKAKNPILFFRRADVAFRRLFRLEPMSIITRKFRHFPPTGIVPLGALLTIAYVLMQTPGDRPSLQEMTKYAFKYTTKALVIREMDVYFKRLQQVRYLSIGNVGPPEKVLMQQIDKTIDFFVSLIQRPLLLRLPVEFNVGELRQFLEIQE